MLQLIARLKASFDELDLNHDGELSFAEVRNAFERLGRDASADEVEYFPHTSYSLSLLVIVHLGYNF